MTQANTQEKLIQYWQEQGVIFVDPWHVFISPNVIIGTGTIIGYNSFIGEQVTIGTNCVIGEFCTISNSMISDYSSIKPFTVISESSIGSQCNIGPFAHIHSNSIIKNNVNIGNFVEIKNSTLDQGTFAKHLSYLGDAIIGQNVNIGAGTITCNFDGKQKHSTIIQDNAFIGSSTTIVAPINIGQDAITGAGSTITQDVPANCLAIGRAHQVNKLEYAQIIRLRQQNKINNTST